MSATGAGYDLSTTTFSPDGKVFQVEYAEKAVEKSGTAVGVRCVDGVVLGVEKLITHKMLAPGSNKKIHTIDRHVGMAVAGLAADARALANVARDEAAEYRSFYGNNALGSVLAKRLAAEVHSHTLYWYLRPFGAAGLLASYDQEGPALYSIETTGTGYRYNATAIGKSSAAVKTELEKLDFSKVTVREALQVIATAIYKAQDSSQDQEFVLELSWVCDESDRKHRMIPRELRDEVIQRAIEAKEREEMDDSDEE